MIKQQPRKQSSLLDVLIVGGGLSGLFVGQGVQRLNVNWKILEARPVLGGRLTNDSKSQNIDLGGAWIWPEHQPNMRELVKSYNLKTFAQPDDPSSTRIDGGAVQFANAIASTFDDPSRVQLNSPVVSCKMDSTGGIPIVQVQTKGEIFRARSVVFAVPPKLLAKHVTFDPPLSPAKQAAMNNSQTWMAGVTKVALVYPKRFWDLQHSNMGLPGSHGPAFQVYDASTADNSVAALTFFSLVLPTSPTISDDSKLAQAVSSQMSKVWKLYGRPDLADRAGSYTDFHIVRWPEQEYISEDRKPTTINPHPSPNRALYQPEWDGLLEFAGSETDSLSPGVMEGAVGAAKRVLKSLEPFLKSHATKHEQCNSRNGP